MRAPRGSFAALGEELDYYVVYLFRLSTYRYDRIEQSAVPDTDVLRLPVRVHIDLLCGIEPDRDLGAEDLRF